MMEQKEYIERDAAIVAAIDATDEWDGGHNHHRAEQIRAGINHVPAANLRPVVRGGWKPNPRNPYWLVCTVCGYGKPERTVYNFCPSCGADMREEP